VLRTADYLEPAAALRPSNQTRANVTVEALADTRLVGGSIPVRFAAGGAPLLGEPDRGFASLDQGLPRDFRYSVWSFTARPTAGELRRSPPQYPSALAEQGLLDVGGGVTMPPFGAPHRTATVEALVARSLVLGRYLPLEHLAEKVAGRARTPYDAAASLESWFLDSGGFRYSNHPTEIAPALVSFVAHTKTGYCQYFAGAMALMLRYLGIPARVAVGFAGGRYDSSQKAWLVTDRDAHAWVEAWFKGYGWLPFDPTPPAPGAARRAIPAGPDVFRGGATVPYSNVAGTGSVATGGTPSVADNLARKNGLGPHHGGGTAGPAVTPARRGGSSDRGRPVLLMLLVLAAAVGAIVLAKAGVRIARGTRRDPRRVAAACREELAAFLVDQRVEAPRSATVRELGAIVEQEFAVSAELFVAAATAARFGPAEEAAAAAQAGRRELRELLDAARRSLTWRERLLGLLSLRSLTRPATRVDASASLDTGMVGSTGS
jgi:transglutaminase-like putative cysteine protease